MVSLNAKYLQASLPRNLVRGENRLKLISIRWIENSTGVEPVTILLWECSPMSFEVALTSLPQKIVNGWDLWWFALLAGERSFVTVRWPSV